MEVHAPHSSVSSLKEALVHILIVTIGILIALGLDGLRETIHEHALVRDARDNFRAELEENRNNLLLEMKAVQVTHDEIGRIVKDFPTIDRDPGQMPARLKGINFPGYFFFNNAWDAAISTGALAHMDTRDVLILGGASKMATTYFQIENTVGPANLAIQVYRDSATMDATQLRDCEQRLRELGFQSRVMLGVEKEYLNVIDKALEIVK